ncbi:MAG TPA: diguanylate cyclase [Rectinemataceae bacterium]|nr:diguanylate cyclase [Rectinemataceae bacterium]
MDEVKTVVVSLLLSSCMAILVICVLAMRKRTTSGLAAVFLTLCGIGAAIYDFGYAMEIRSTTLSGVLFWVRFQHWGIQSIPLLWLLFTLCIMGKRKFITPISSALLCFMPLVALACSQTLGGLNLLHPNPHLGDGAMMSLFLYDRGWAIYLVTGIQSIYLLASAILFVVGLIRGVPVPRTQTLIYLTGSLLPWLNGLAYNMGLIPYNLDSTPLVLSISMALFMIGFLKVGILDIAPLARDVIFEGTNDGILVIDRRGRITDFNSCMRSIMPFLDRAMTGIPAREVLANYGTLRGMLDEEEPAAIEFRPGGESDRRTFRITAAQLKGSSNKDLGKLLTFHDVTEMKELHRRLEFIAIHDELTGLYNRRYLNEFASREIEKAKRGGDDFSVIMLDLDYFKLVNDTLGHAGGDQALMAVATICRNSVRESDVVGRFGGEEILVLLPGTSYYIARGFAEKMRCAIQASLIPFEGENIKLTASFGVASMSPSLDSLKTLLISVDRALYKAKASGRNRVC